MRSNDKMRVVSRIRKAMILVARSQYRFKARALADYLNRDISAISQVISRTEEQKSSYPELAQIEASLSNLN